jgi:UDP-3-O-[3-hydroxymyristoyl] glucosamine N-acyltransferase
VEIRDVAPLESAGPADLAFAAGRKASREGEASRAGCLIVPLDFPNPDRRTLIRARDPRGAFARAVRLFRPGGRRVPGIHPGAQIAADALLGTDVTIDAHVTIGAASRVGDRTCIGAGSSIGDRVTIGPDSTIHPNVVIYDDVEIGARAVIHAGAVIGADGFGFVFERDHYEKFPQIGRVSIGNDVEIGAHSAVDRAALGVTSIGDGTKLDNMVHVGHNSTIGKHVVVAAQTGFSGGVSVGDYAVVGGQVGVGDKARIESRAVVGSGAGILTSKIVRAGEPVWGTPARPLKEYLELLAHFGRLPEIRTELMELRRRLDEMEGE